MHRTLERQSTVMNTLNIGKRYPIASAIMVLMGLALLVMPLVPTTAAAPVETDVPIEDRAQMQQAECVAAGGALFSHYFFDAAGLATAQVICEARGWVCDNTRTTEDCYTVGRFAQLTPAVVPDERPDTVAPSENPEENVPVVDDRVAPPGGVAEDPTAGDETIARQTLADQAVAACEAMGGTATVNAQHPTATFDVECTGGMLDEMVCYGTICDYFSDRASPGEDAQAPPTGGIEFVRVESETELEAALRGVAEDPTGGETVVIVYQSDLSVGEKTKGQKALCEGLGGKATPIEDSGPEVSVVKCTGGLLGGMTCFNSEDATNCMFRSSVTPEGPRVTPAAGIEVPAMDAPTATASATGAPPTPTVMQTETPTVAPTATAKAIFEATVVPTSDPPPPKNDNSVPPSGPVEDPTQNEPTPTGAPLL